MGIVHLPNTSSLKDVVATLLSDHSVIIDRLAPPERIDQIEAELGPYIERSSYGRNSIAGKLTRRTNAIIARAPSARDLVMHPLIIGACEAYFPKDYGFRLSLTELMSLYPGSPAQFLHRDESGFGRYPFDLKYPIYLAALWAMSDYTEEMGATRVVPGSYALPHDARLTDADSVPAEMERGSVLIYTGKLYHGSGENRSNKIRKALGFFYGNAWTRQEENQYLNCPAEIARTLPHDLLRVMGYSTVHGWGRVGDFHEPLNFLLGELVEIERPPS